ncbi:hypothetical protein D779_2072 [Imhoffiella purpurea]|uniref:Uncharacterized protein n=2 Tax=Imhoffiella purpurea TaxID=1249627 RepID=W9VD15_9GAMM|nr:hypothetical protein D779_2072 [Imhoffiella purpurea]
MTGVKIGSLKHLRRCASFAPFPAHPDPIPLPQPQEPIPTRVAPSPAVEHLRGSLAERGLLEALVELRPLPGGRLGVRLRPGLPTATESMVLDLLDRAMEVTA